MYKTAYFILLLKCFGAYQPVFLLTPLFFDELPDHLSVLGYVIIISMAVFKWIYTMRHEEEKKENTKHD
jgi:hypothetical protein